MSLDGFIAKNNDDISWLSIVEKEGEDYGYEAFNKTVDTYIVGRKTYDVVLKLTGGKFPAADRLQCFVLTSSVRKPERGINFYSGDIVNLVQKLKSTNGRNIYCDGGSIVVKSLMDNNLIDEYIISVIPVLLGSGKRLFKGETPMIGLKLKSSKEFETGLVQLHYERV